MNKRKAKKIMTNSNLINKKRILQMIKAKQVNIKKNKWFTVDMNDLDPFLLDIKKESSKEIDIYYINYIQKKFNSSNQLRVKLNSATGYFKEKNDDKYLILDSTKEYESVWSEIKSEIKRINGGEEVFYEKVIVKLALILKMICLSKNY